MCVGIHPARLERGTLFERLADQVARFDMVTSRPPINNGLRGLGHLEVTVERAGDGSRGSAA